MWAPVCRLSRVLETCQKPGPRRWGVISTFRFVEGGLMVASFTVTDRSMWRRGMGTASSLQGQRDRAVALGREVGGQRHLHHLAGLLRGHQERPAEGDRLDEVDGLGLHGALVH